MEAPNMLKLAIFSVSSNECLEADNLPDVKGELQWSGTPIFHEMHRLDLIEYGG